MEDVPTDEFTETFECSTEEVFDRLRGYVEPDTDFPPDQAEVTLKSARIDAPDWEVSETKQIPGPVNEITIKLKWRELSLDEMVQFPKGRLGAKMRKAAGL